MGVTLAWVARLFASQNAAVAAAYPEGAAGGPESLAHTRAVPVAAAVAAMVFLLHPLNIQAVTYVVQRMSSLAALFDLLSLGSKENAFVLPLVVALHEACFYRGDWIRLARSLHRRHRAWLLVLGALATVSALALLLTVGIVDLGPRWRRVALAGSLALLVPLAIAAYRLNLTWADSLGLHFDAAEKSPGKYRPQYNLGTQLGKAGRLAEAVPYLQKAVQLRADSAQAHNQLGSVYLRLGRLEQALPELETAVALDPDHAYARDNLAFVLDRLGRSREAIPHFRHFLRVVPDKLTVFVGPVRRRLRELSAQR